MSKWSIFVRNYESIRQMLNIIYTYGCYDANQIIDDLDISRRTYEKNLSLLRYICSNLKKGKSFKKHLINYFPFDRYNDDENYLWHSYQLRTFNRQDINLYFLLLSKFASENDIYLSLDELLGYLDDSIFDDTDDESHRHMLFNKLEEMVDWGILEMDSSEIGKYHLVNNILDDFSEEELLMLYDLLFFYRDILPLSSIGYFLQQEIKDYLYFEKGRKEVIELRTFLTKDIFLQTILNDEVIFCLKIAMEKNKQTCFRLGNLDVNDFSPWYFIFDRQNGKQYIWGTIKNKEAIYRLDKINNVQLLDADREILSDDILKGLYSMWSAAITENILELHDVILNFHINESTNKWRKESLLRQKRHGEITKIKDSYFQFKIKVRNLRELLPWIRSWTPYVTIQYFDNQQLIEKLYNDWKVMCDVYDKKIFFEPIEPLKNANYSKFNTEFTKNEKSKTSSTNVFPEYRNLYYIAVREVFYRMILEGENFNKHALKHIICQRSGIQNTNFMKEDYFLQEITNFGGNITAISLFRENAQKIMKPAFPLNDALPPILLSHIEKRYLHGLLKQNLITKLLSEERSTLMQEKLKDYPSFTWEETLIERGQEPDIDILNYNVFNNFLIIRNTIKSSGCLYYENHTKDKCYIGICKPYKIMFSARTRKFQLIAAAKQKNEDQPRLVLMNLTNIHNLVVTKDSLSSIDVSQMLKNKRSLHIRLKLRNLPENGNSDISRAFMLFSTHTKRGLKDDKGIYHLWIDAYDFEREEIIFKILSLGKAVEVISPLNLRNEVSERIRTALHTF